MFNKEEYWAKHFIPIDVTDDGIIISISFLHFLKHESPSDLADEGIDI